jgi:hypothetical protein
LHNANFWVPSSDYPFHWENIMLTCTLLVMSLMVGQAEEPVSNYDHLKELEVYVGEWIGKAKIPEAADAPAAGKEVTVPVTTKWILNKNVLLAEWKVKVGDEVVNQGKWSWWWDAKRNQIRALSINMQGSFGESTWTKQGNKLVAEWIGATGQGEVTHAILTTTAADSDTLIHSWTHQKRGDEPQPDYQVEYHRLKSE